MLKNKLVALSLREQYITLAFMVATPGEKGGRSRERPKELRHLSNVEFTETVENFPLML